MSSLTYWYALANMRGITKNRKNQIFVNAYNNEISIEQLFENSETWSVVGLSGEEVNAFTAAQQKLVNNSFEVENLLSQGYNIIPMSDNAYSKALTQNLHINVPTVLYTKGNVKLLNQKSVAIVGSRKATEKSLRFTAAMAQKCVENNDVVVSGFAEGVDQMALDATLEAGGKFIIVLPQGIATVTSKIRKYYKPIIQGRLLVISTFAPKAPWTIGFAMERNQYIYGLADEIYVAQSDDKGGTWEGVMNGLRNKRKVYVRKPDDDEINANMLLIQKGATPVDFNGCVVEMSPEEKMTPQEKEEKRRQEEIQKLLKGRVMSSKEIAEKITLPRKDTKAYLRALPFVRECKRGNTIYFFIKGEETVVQQTLDMQ